MTIKAVLNDSRAPVKLWTDLSEVEPAALQQLRNTASLPFVFSHVAAMPDVHLGIGATVGSVVATRGAIIPAAVGVDIGCGMAAVKLPFSIEQLGGDGKLRKLRTAIERSIPVGRDGNRNVGDRVGEAFTSLGDSPTCVPKDATRNAALQLGSLGGGNHFIEICTDKEGNAWVMLHSGSRNIGKRVAEIHINQAKYEMKQLKESLADPNLAYFLESTRAFQDYMRDLQWCQNYARANRNEMMLRVLRDVSRHVYQEDKGPDFMTRLRVDCHHNYVEQEEHFGRKVWVTRKGAVRARRNDLGIIPGSMGAKSYIVRGLGNPESFHSCSHGAGRKMSRTEAKRRFNLEDLKRQTSGVECRKDSGVLDEIPAAYKDIDEVMANQTDLVEVVAELRQIICIKG